MKNLSTNPGRQKAGFTLIELLIVIAVIAALSAIGIGGMHKYRTAADASASMSSIRQLQIANQMYAADHGGKYVGVAWATNSDYLAELTGNANPVPDDLPKTVLDPAVYRSKRPGFASLPQSYGYVVAGMSGGESFRMSEVVDPARSAAFITAATPAGQVGYTAAPVTEEAAESGAMGVVLRHDDAAIVVYYDGHVEELKQSDFSRIASEGGAQNVFWKPNPSASVP